MPFDKSAEIYTLVFNSPYTQRDDRLNALEEEEAALEAQGAYAPEEEDEDELDEEEMILYKAIKEKQGIARKESHKPKPTIARKFTTRGRSEQDVREHFAAYDTDADALIENMRGRKRTRSASASARDAGSMDVDGARGRSVERKKSARDRSVSVQRYVCPMFMQKVE